MFKIIASVCFFLVIFQASSQSISREVVAASGDFYTTQDGSLSWTLGEIMTETDTVASHILTQGFQQSRLIPLFIAEPAFGNIKIYPNPAQSKLIISLEQPAENAYLTVLTPEGRKVFSCKMMHSRYEEIDIGHLASGLYLIQMVENKKLKAIYRFIKK